jgi:hypothetical protein
MRRNALPASTVPPSPDTVLRSLKRSPERKSLEQEEREKERNSHGGREEIDERIEAIGGAALQAGCRHYYGFRSLLKPGSRNIWPNIFPKGGVFSG